MIHHVKAAVTHRVFGPLLLAGGALAAFHGSLGGVVERLQKAEAIIVQEAGETAHDLGDRLREMVVRP